MSVGVDNSGSIRTNPIIAPKSDTSYDNWATAPLCNVGNNVTSNKSSTSPEQLNFYGSDASGEFYVFIEVYENENGQRVRLNSDFFFFEYIRNFGVRGVKPLRTISNGKKKRTFDNAQNAF